MNHDIGEGQGVDDLLADNPPELHQGIAALTKLTALEIAIPCPSDSLSPLSKLVSLRDLSLQLDDADLMPRALPLTSPSLTSLRRSQKRSRK